MYQDLLIAEDYFDIDPDDKNTSPNNYFSSLYEQRLYEKFTSKVKDPDFRHTIEGKYDIFSNSFLFFPIYHPLRIGVIRALES